MNHDTPETIAITDKAARELMLSELLQVCTPAPWFATGEGVRSAGGYIAFTPKPFHYPSQNERYEREVLEREANARLIAAAPETAVERDKLKAINSELLEALQQMTTYVASFTQDKTGWKKLDAARAVIAKASEEKFKNTLLEIINTKGIA